MEVTDKTSNTVHADLHGDRIRFDSFKLFVLFQHHVLYCFIEQKSNNDQKEKQDKQHGTTCCLGSSVALNTSNEINMYEHLHEISIFPLTLIINLTTSWESGWLMKNFFNEKCRDKSINSYNNHSSWTDPRVEKKEPSLLRNPCLSVGEQYLLFTEICNDGIEQRHTHTQTKRDGTLMFEPRRMKKILVQHS